MLHGAPSFVTLKQLILMPENYCDCGSAIPEKASFCPGCGKPLTAETREAERVANQLPTSREGEEPKGPLQDVDFGTPGALRACYWSAAFAAFFLSYPPLLMLCFAIYPAAGFYTVFSFKRRSHREISVRAGAKLGFMTGVIAFALGLVLLALLTVMPGSPEIGEGLNQYADILDDEGQPQAAAQVRELRDDRGMLAIMVLMFLGIGFAAATVFTTAGGALGAKVFERE